MADPRDYNTADDAMVDNAAEEAALADETSLSHLFGSSKDIVSRYTHCALCGGNLHFTHITDFGRNLTQELAKCPECGIKARQVLHRLQ